MPPVVGEQPSGVTPAPTVIIIEEPTDEVLPATSGPCVDTTVSEPPALAGQGVEYPIPNLVGQVLYSWTTVEQAQELRSGAPLLSRTERPGAGPGHAIEFLTSGFYPPTAEEEQLVALLVSPEFARARYAWPHAWATRMGWPATEEGPAESYGNQLLRITVKTEALWVVFVERRLWVVDSTGAQLAIGTAFEAPERIAGIYFQKDRTAADVSCGGSFGLGLNGSAYREFILMNPSMIESWELGTETIREVVQADVGRLERLFAAIRGCSAVTSSFSEWAASVTCENWAGTDTEVGEYEKALALLNSLYLPRPQQIADIVATLQSDLEAWDIVIERESFGDGGVSDATVVGESAPSDTAANP